MSKKIFIVGTCGVPNNYGGFESLAENLVYNDNYSTHYTVFCERSRYPNATRDFLDNCTRIFLPISANGISSIIYDVLSLIICIIKRPDIVLVLGSSGAFFIPVVRLLTFGKVKIIFNLDGREWAREKWNKLAKLYLKYSEMVGVQFSNHVVADNKVITDYVRRSYVASVSEIAYGGDNALQPAEVAPTQEIKSYFLALCRIEPENNVHHILEAFSKSTKNLIFIGNWENSHYGNMLREQYKASNQITLLDPIYDPEKLYHYRRNCIAYIHGHSAGGTNPSLVEMMHFSAPIMAYNCDYNRYTLGSSGKFFTSANDLFKLINDPNFGWGSPEEIYENVEYQNKLAQEEYTWQIICQKYNRLFEDVLKTKSKVD